MYADHTYSSYRWYIQMCRSCIHTFTSVIHIMTNTVHTYKSYVQFIDTYRSTIHIFIQTYGSYIHSCIHINHILTYISYIYIYIYIYIYMVAYAYIKKIHADHTCSSHIHILHNIHIMHACMHTCVKTLHTYIYTHTYTQITHEHIHAHRSYTHTYIHTKHLYTHTRIFFSKTSTHTSRQGNLVTLKTSCCWMMRNWTKTRKSLTTNLRSSKMKSCLQAYCHQPDKRMVVIENRHVECEYRYTIGRTRK